MRLLFVIAISWIASKKIYAQGQERKIIVYNAAFGGLTAGIGSLINKPKNANWRIQFIKGFWQGAIGGSLNYTAKKTIYLVAKQRSAAWGFPALLLHSAGTSIVNNAASNGPFLERWAIDFGPVRIAHAFDKKEFRVRPLPMAVISPLLVSRYGSLDLSTTLLTGRFAFQSKDSFLVYDGVLRNGLSFGRAFAYGNQKAGRYEIMAHELIHQQQYGEYVSLNAWFKGAFKKVKSSNAVTFFAKYIYPDTPFFFLPYELEGRFDDYRFYRNFFEFEAERISTNQYVPVN